MQETFKEILKELKNELNKVQSKCKSIAIKDGRSLDYEFYGGKSEAYTKAIEIVEQAAAVEYNNWIPHDEPPKTDDYVLLSFENFRIPMVGRYEEDEEGGAYYIGDEDKTCVSHDVYVNAWQPLPKPYNPKIEVNYKLTNGDKIRSMSNDELAEFLTHAETLGYNDSSVSGKLEMIEWLKLEAEG